MGRAGVGVGLGNWSGVEGSGGCLKQPLTLCDLQCDIIWGHVPERKRDLVGETEVAYGDAHRVRGAPSCDPFV